MTTLSGLSSQVSTTDAKVTGIQTTVGTINTTTGAIQTAVNALHNDPRTVITTAPFTISTPGSYVLGANLAVTNGTAITINADNVTLDLNGFTISSTANPASGYGVYVFGIRRNIEVKNGSIIGTTVLAGSLFTPGGFSMGCIGGVGSGIRLSSLRITAIAGMGVSLGDESDPGSLVENCVVQICAGQGISAHTVRLCSVRDTIDTAIRAAAVSDSSGVTAGLAVNDHGIVALTVSNSVGVAPAGGNGIQADSVENSSGTSVSGTGINGGVVSNSRGRSTDGPGIRAATVHNSRGESGAGQGISVDESVIGSTGISTSNRGISCSGNVSNCTGKSTSSQGIEATGNVSNSTGISSSGVGLQTSANITNCYGESTSGPQGINCGGTASFSQAKKDGGTAAFAKIAIGCTVSGTGTFTATQRFLGTP